MERKNNLAFVKVCNEEIIKKLIDMGYEAFPSKESLMDGINENTCLATGQNSVVAISEWEFRSTNPHITWNTAGRVDCGTDVDKFLEIASNINKRVTYLIHIGYFNDVADLNDMTDRDAEHIIDCYNNGYGKFYWIDKRCDEPTFKKLDEIDADPEDCIFSNDGKYLITFTFDKGEKFDEDKEVTDDFIDLYKVVTLNKRCKYKTYGTATEMCSNCEEEFETPSELGVYRCPFCGRWQVNCSMCMVVSDNANCEQCPLDYEANMRNEVEDMKDGFE